MNAIAGYELQSVLHDGLRTVVYRARRQADGAPVVLKCLKAEELTADDVARFHNEHEITRRIEADWVMRPQLLEGEGGRPFMVFDAGAGVPLSDFFPPPADLEPALVVMLATLRAVGAIHQAGVVHKDLEPANILVDRSTGSVRIIDFAIASLLTREQPELVDAHALEGALRYLSPERTGRMNRAVDYRTDFYTLGAVFYELLVGEPVFDSRDPMELVHHHIAKRPVVPEAARRRLPEVVLGILLKLLAKTPEERYQSTGGIIRDVERCLEELRRTGTVTPFPLGEHDSSDRFALPQRLYGRKPEIDRLVGALEKVAAGDKRVVLLAGPSGIGKSALVREVQRPLGRGYFAAGKCEQLQRHLPYSAMVQAMRELVTQLLGEDQARLARWRTRLREALGGHARVLVDLIPDLSQLTGPLPEVDAVETEEVEARLAEAFRRLLRLVAAPEHPLVLFLDDLQWIDNAALSLVRSLLTDPQLTHLLFVGAYRDNEVGAAHPLALAMTALDQAGTPVDTLALSALGVQEVAELCADTLHRPPAELRPLAETVQACTDGNPFFIRQYLDHLHHEGAIRFLHASGSWSWDPVRLAEIGVGDGVVELTRAKIRKTPPATQEALQVAACIGASFDLATLAAVTDLPPAELAERLARAVSSGIVVLVGDSYRVRTQQSAPASTFRFVHDRVQQAAYELLPPAERQRAHLRIARVLLAAGEEENLFEIVGHLGWAWDLIDSPEERRRVLRLNLAAGKRAKRNAAYDIALRWLRQAMEHLPPEPWAEEPTLTAELHLERAECEYLCGHFQTAEELLGQALGRLKSRTDRAAAYAILIQMRTNRGQTTEAIRLGLEALAMFGVETSASPSPDEVTAAIRRTQGQLESVTEEQILTLPPMVDREKLAMLRILNRLGPPAYFADPGLYYLLHCLVIELAIKFGHASESVRGYSVYGLILGAQFGAYQEGHRYGALAIKLADRTENLQMKGVSRTLYGCFIAPWTRPAEESLPDLHDGYRYLRDAGNLVLASYALCVHAETGWIKGDPIGQVGTRAGQYADYLRGIRYRDMAPFMETLRQVSRALAGATASPLSLDDGDYREEAALEVMTRTTIRTPLHFHYIVKMQLAYLFGDLAAAARMGRLSGELLGASRGLLHNSEHYFYTALVALARADAEPAEPRLQEARGLLATWAGSCPANFAAKHHLVEAEVARVEGRHEAAMELYDRALAAARDQRNLAMEALAAELAGRYHLARDRQLIATAYLRHSHLAYSRWGATAKTAELRRQYGALLGAGAAPDTQDRLRAATGVGMLDVGSIMKATRTIAEEIVLERLVKTFVRIVIESAGAESGHLVFVDDGERRVVARGHVDDPGEAQSLDVALPAQDEISPAVVEAVIERQDLLVYEDAAREPSLRSDRVLRRRGTRSLLCFPVMQRGRLSCVVYLENNLAPGVFTAGRVEILRILAAQAAISIENARLYAGLQEKLVELEEAHRQIADKERLRREMEIASRIQTGLCPRVLAVPGLQIAAVMRPASEVGGDYYDVIPTAEGCWIGIGDVAGHGMPSGLVMVMIQSGVASLVRQSPRASPSSLLPALNAMIYDNVHTRLGQDEHATLTLLRYHQGRLVFAGAHEEMVICRAVDGRCEIVPTPGAWLGVRRMPAQPEGACTLDPGDLLLLYTDGAIECRNHRKQELGVERLCAELSRMRTHPVEAIRDHLMGVIVRWMGKGVQADDITLMVVRREP